ncbi:hypothetical protein JAAARDRAFT_28354 [Jaapia argillacea MUCL 33604]|uniref:Ubiquitin-like domain-containing protein n=1 Tax=Jaapia argillacea MUCL 33604 TaxID=933084 RepID=A0A067QCL4_9AGAM|nr:hypothetical protein JAAARDRAFT_28354 [Jaapia argillacea MUCL 33604]
MSTVSLKVELPAYSLSFHVEVPLSSSVLDIKHRIYTSCVGAPRVDGQRLIWRGRFLRDEERVQDIWKSPDDPHTIHLAVHSSAWSSTPPEIPSSSTSPPPVGAPRALSPPPSSHLPSYTTTPQSRPIATPSYLSSPPYASQQPPSNHPMAYVLSKHNNALSALSQVRFAPNDNAETQTRQTAINAVERCGWSWPPILDEPFPAPGNESEGIKYERVTIEGQTFLSLITPNATPTPLQSHALKVLTYTFPLLLTPVPYQTPLSTYATSFSFVVPPGNLNAQLQQLGLPQLRVNNPPNAANLPEMRDIPIRALLAPLVMLTLRTVLLLYFVSPTRKPFLGIMLGAWVLYEAWGAIRAVLGPDPQQQRDGDGNARGGAAGGAAQQQPQAGVGAQGAAGNGPAPAQPNAAQAVLAPQRPRAQGPGGHLQPGNGQTNRTRSQTSMLLDSLAIMNLQSEEIALTASPISQPVPEPSFGHKVKTFASLLVLTLHPAVWNRRRTVLKAREGRVRTEANARENPGNVQQEGGEEEESEERRQENERRERAKVELIAQHQRRSPWVRTYIERVRGSEWSDD